MGRKICQEKDLPASLAARQVLKDWLQRQSEPEEGNSKRRGPSNDRQG